jgi:hypothetical protein
VLLLLRRRHPGHCFGCKPADAAATAAGRTAPLPRRRCDPRLPARGALLLAAAERCVVARRFGPAAAAREHRVRGRRCHDDGDHHDDGAVALVRLLVTQNLARLCGCYPGADDAPLDTATAATTTRITASPRSSSSDEDAHYYPRLLHQLLLVQQLQCFAMDDEDEDEASTAPATPGVGGGGAPAA